MLGCVGAPQAPFGRVVLVTGPEALLADRAVTGIVAACRLDEPQVDVAETEAIRLDPGSLATMSGGSLFASRSVVVVRDLANLPTPLTDQLLALATDPLPDLALVLVHGGGVKGKALLDKLRKAKVEVVECPAVKPWELAKFVTAEVRRAGGRIDNTTAQALVDAVGSDLRALAAAGAQLMADAEDDQISQNLIRRYFGGRAEVTSFKVSDAALAGNLTAALEQLRWALSTGVAHVLVTSALALGLRRLVKYASLQGTGMRDHDLAREVGVTPNQLKNLRPLVRRWDPSQLSQAMRAVARADAEVKGAASDPDFAVEQVVLAVSRQEF